MKNLPNLKFHTKLQSFFNDLSVPMWLKLIHLFILIDSKATHKKNGYTIFYQNPGLIKKFTIRNSSGSIIWTPSLETIQQSIAKLEKMKLLKRDVSAFGQRKIKLNRALIIEFLRHNSIDTDIYSSFEIKSRERKFIRRKILTITDYLTSNNKAQAAQFKKYLEYQCKKYKYDITISDIDVFAIDFDIDRFVTPAEIEYYKHATAIDKELDQIYDRMR